MVIAGCAMAGVLALTFVNLHAESQRSCFVPILMYHDVGATADSPWCVPEQTFRSQMTSLRAQGYKTILPSDIPAHFKWGKPLPRKPIIITFDDGYLGNLTVIEPILKENGLQAMIYLITGQVAETAAARREYEGKKCLVWPEVLAMQKRRTFAFGGHSHSHGNLAASGEPLPDIAECLRQLKQHGIHRPYAFCYPFGQYKPDTIKAVQEAGFQTAVVCEDVAASIGPATNLFALPRVSVMGGKHDFKLLKKEADVKTKSLVYRVLHTGIPLEISASLHASGDGKNIWLPAREVSQGEFELRFTSPDNTMDDEGKSLEIWDKHRLFKLATINQ